MANRLDALVFEVRTDGDDDNGGGFMEGSSGTDYSQQASAQATLTTASVLDGTFPNRVLVDAGDHTVSANDVGNVLQITGGTATADVYVITSVNVGSNYWTLDRNAGSTGATVVGKMGGAWATPGKISDVMRSSSTSLSSTYSRCRVWIKSGVYTVTTTTRGSGGPIDSDGNPSRTWHIEGYHSTRGDCPAVGSGNQPVMSVGAGVTTFDVIKITNVSFGNTEVTLKAIKVDGNDETGTNGFNVSAAYHGCMRVIGCHATACGNNGFTGGMTRVLVSNCLADNNGAAGFLDGFACMTHCIARDNTGDGFSASQNQGSRHYCIADGNGANGFDMETQYGIIHHHCVAVNNGADGFDCYVSYDMHHFVRCVASNNGGYGWYIGNSAKAVFFHECFEYNNTSGDINSDQAYTDEITTTASDPIPSHASEDYTPSTDAIIPGGDWLTGDDVYAGAVPLVDSGGGGSGAVGFPLGRVVNGG